MVPKQKSSNGKHTFVSELLALVDQYDPLPYAGCDGSISQVQKLCPEMLNGAARP